MSTRGQSPRPREQPVKTEACDLMDWKQSEHGQPVGDKGREVLGAVRAGWSTGGHWLLPQVRWSHRGLRQGRDVIGVESPGPFAVCEKQEGGGRNRSSETQREVRDKADRSKVWSYKWEETQSR